MEKTCVVSALDDELHTIKTYVVNAAKKQGLSQETQVTALADGAKNCWSVLSALQTCVRDPRVYFGLVPYCAEVSAGEKCLGRGFCPLLRERQMETVAWQRRRCPDETGCAARQCL
jgi:hypothetical protein